MKRVIFVTPSYPGRRYVAGTFDAKELSLDAFRTATLPVREEVVEIPNFFPGDGDGRLLANAIYRVIDRVKCETAHAPVRVDLGRFTFLEFLAHSENRIESRGGRMLGKDVSFEEGKIAEFCGTELRLAPGPDHFVRAVPVATWTMINGTPDGWYVAPQDVFAAATEAIAKAIRSVPPRA